MPKYRMLALDLDGTILRPDGLFSSRTKDAIALAQSAGYLLCIATGRNFTESRQIVSDLGIAGECVFVGGAVVIDTRTGRTLQRTAMHPALAAEFCGVIESMGHAALALQDTGSTGIDYLITRDLPLHSASKKWMGALKMDIQYFPRLAQHPHANTLRVGMCVDAADAEAIHEQLLSHFAERTMICRLLVPGSLSHVIEAFDPAVSKWGGIQYIAARHQVAAEEIIAVGDDLNDVQMLRHAGLGVAMGNARPGLKEIADRVIGSIHEDGLAVFIEGMLK